MPFTLFHLGPALLIGIIGWKYLDFPTLILGSIVVDIRTFFVFIGVLDAPLHGLLHTFAGGTLLSFILIGGITPFREYIGRQMVEISLPQISNDSTVVGAAFLSIYLHLFLDSIIYSDMQPFMPLTQNPLPGLTSITVIYAFCVLTAIVGLSLIPWRTSTLNSRRSLSELVNSI